MDATVAGEKISWLAATHIRFIEKKDLLALEWDGEYAHFRKVYAEAYRRFQQGVTLIWVADVVQFGVIGQAFIQLIAERKELADGFERSYLYSFRIKPEFRNLGIGSYMLKTIERDLLQRGFCYLTLNVAKTNMKAISLYQRSGYEIVAHEPGRWSYPDENGAWREVVEPAWRMQKMLVD